MRRKGLGKGTGKGYKNIIGRDSSVHSQSAKGIKQPISINESKLNSMDKRLDEQDKKYKINDKLHNLTIEQTFVPRGSGNNPLGGKRDLHYKIKEWGFIFSTKEEAEKYANEHKRISSGQIVKK